MSEDAFVCTNCAYRVKIESDRVHRQVKVESDRAHMPFVSAAENREWDELLVRRPLEGVWCLQRIHPSRTALTACWSACIGMEPLMPRPKPRRPNPPPTPSRQFPSSNHWVARRDCCLRAARTSASKAGAFLRRPVQRLDVSRRPNPNVSSSPLAREPVLHLLWRFRGLVRRHVRRAV
jgi:hypothetical protein